MTGTLPPARPFLAKQNGSLERAATGLSPW